MKRCHAAYALIPVSAALSTGVVAAMVTRTMSVSAYVPFTITVPANAAQWLTTGWRQPPNMTTGAAPRITLAYDRPGIDLIILEF